MIWKTGLLACCFILLMGLMSTASRIAHVPLMDHRLISRSFFRATKVAMCLDVHAGTRYVYIALVPKAFRRNLPGCSGMISKNRRKWMILDPTSGGHRSGTGAMPRSKFHNRHPDAQFHGYPQHRGRSFPARSTTSRSDRFHFEGFSLRSRKRPSHLPGRSHPQPGISLRAGNGTSIMPADTARNMFTKSI